MQRRRLLSIIVCASTVAAPLFVSRTAHAQGWLANRRYAEGIGIKVGNFELHPGVGLSAGIDSNLFNRTYNTGYANSNPAAAGIFAITPSLFLSTLGPERKEGDINAAPPTIDFRLGAAATYRAYVGDQDVVNQNGINGLSGALNGRVDILPKRPFSVGLQAGYTRTLNPNTTGNPDQNFNQNLVNVGADFTITPGGGTLAWKFGYGGNFDFFDASGGANPDAPFNNLQNTFFTRGTWKFGPKTAVIYDGNFAFVNYTQTAVAFNGLQNSTPLRSRLGLNGLIGTRFGLTAFAGYGGSFAQTPAGWGTPVSQYDSVIGQLEAKFFLTANPSAELNPSSVGLSVSSIAIGYNRDFSQSYLGSFYGSDRGYLKFSYLFGGRFLLSLEGGGGAREYPQIFDHTGAQIGPNGGFVDGAVDATLFAEYRFTNTLGLNLTGKYTEEISSTALPSDNSGDLYHMAFRRFEAYLGFRWFM